MLYNPRVSAIVLAILFIAAQASAATLSFSGQVSRVRYYDIWPIPPEETAAVGGIRAGASVAGTFEINPAILDSESSTEQGEYFGALVSLSASIGGMTF